MRYAHVVLGARVSAGGNASPALTRRALAAAELANTGDAQLLILSGGGIPSEAMVASEIIAREGGDPSLMRLDEDAANTFENIVNAWAIAREEGKIGLVLISDTAHLPRAKLIAKILGIPARGYPVPARFGVPAFQPLAKLVIREAISTPNSVLRALMHRLLGSTQKN